MTSKLIIGAGDWLDIACDAWKSSDANLSVQRIEIPQDKSYYFDVGFLKDWSASQATAFVAFDDRFLNFKRLELMGILKAQGFQMPAFVSPRAILGGGVEIGENVFVGDGAVIGSATEVSYNAYIGPGVRMGHGCRIGHSAWLDGSILGDRVVVGSHTSIGAGITITSQTEIGKFCEIRVPGFYKDSIPAKTYYNPNFDGPMRIYN